MAQGKRTRKHYTLHERAGQSFIRKLMLITRRGHMKPPLLGRICPKREREAYLMAASSYAVSHWSRVSSQVFNFFAPLGILPSHSR